MTDYPQERKNEVKDIVVKHFLDDYETIMKVGLGIREDYHYFDSIETVVRTDEGSYQGDSIILLKRWNEYYIANWGWGSCSGCDALEASNDNADSLAELVLDYQSSITPKLDSEEAVLVYIEKEKVNSYNKEMLHNFEIEVKKYFDAQKTKEKERQL